MSGDCEGCDDELGVAASFVMAFAVGFATTTIVGVAIAWNVVSLAVEAAQTLRRR
jgi:hypothetical protein